MRSIGPSERPGFTMVEIMVALAGFLVVIVGALSFQYYCAVDTREADVRAGANRLALMLLEGWRGSGGRVDGTYAYNPIVEFGNLLDIESTTFEMAGPGVAFGLYKIDANRANYFATLRHVTNGVDPRTLVVTVAWSASYRAEIPDEYVRHVTLTTNIENVGLEP